MSPSVAVVLVFAPGLARPYPLIPGEEYRFCTGRCNAIFRFVTRAVAAHESTKETAVGAWTKAIVVFDDGEGSEVHAHRIDEQATA